MIDKKTYSKLKMRLEEAVCTDVRTDHGYLYLEFGTVLLIIQSAWRIIENGEIIAGCGNDGDINIPSLHVLKDRVIRRVIVGNDYNDLRLEFKHGVLLESFADVGDFEHWNLCENGNPNIIGGPGRLWSTF